jgi:hypothetical protein
MSKLVFVETKIGKSSINMGVFKSINGSVQITIGSKVFETDKKNGVPDELIKFVNINKNQIESLQKIINLRNLYSGVLLESGYYKPSEYGNIETVGVMSAQDLADANAVKYIPSGGVAVAPKDFKLPPSTAQEEVKKTKMEVEEDVEDEAEDEDEENDLFTDKPDEEDEEEENNEGDDDDM